MKTIDLGSKPEKMEPMPAEPDGDEEDPKIYYPTLYLSDIEGADDLPNGEFTAIVKCKVRSKTTSEREDQDEPRVSVDLDVMSITPQAEKKGKKSAPSDDDAVEAGLAAAEKSTED